MVIAWETPVVKKGGNATGQSCDTLTRVTEEAVVPRTLEHVPLPRGSQGEWRSWSDAFCCLGRTVRCLYRVGVKVPLPYV